MSEKPSYSLFKLLNQVLDEARERARLKPLNVVVALHGSADSEDKIRKVLRGADDEILGLTWKKARDEGWQHIRLIVEDELDRRLKNRSTPR